MERLRNFLDRIRPVDGEWRTAAQKRLDQLTKPPGSLGRLEEIALWYVEASGKFPPRLPDKMVFVFAADHGVTAERVSAYPKAVTAQMVYNFINGGAAMNVLGRHAGASVRVVDIGVDHDFEGLSRLIDRKIARGSRNLVVGPAMSEGEAVKALLTGCELAEQAKRDGVGLLGTGEMGIGNTTASSAITAVLTGSSVEAVTGCGTGIDHPTLLRKRSVIEKALTINRPSPDDPIGLLGKVGGFEIGGIAGLILGAAAHRVPVVIDGFISTAAALVAAALKPEVKGYLLAAHRSAEPGHDIALKYLGLIPLLDFRMRLGEGTGAALGIGMVEAAVRLLTEMATFEEAGVARRNPE